MPPAEFGRDAPTGTRLFGSGGTTRIGVEPVPTKLVGGEVGDDPGVVPERIRGGTFPAGGEVFGAKLPDGAKGVAGGGAVRPGELKPGVVTLGGVAPGAVKVGGDAG